MPVILLDASLEPSIAKRFLPRLRLERIAARRNAEALLGNAQKREAGLRLERERENEAIALKTARLRELRLAKEADDKAAADKAAEDKAARSAAGPRAPRASKPRRSRQT